MKTANSFLPNPSPMYAANCSDGSILFDDLEMLQLCKELELPLYIRLNDYESLYANFNKLLTDYDSLLCKYQNLLSIIIGSGEILDRSNLKIREFLSDFRGEGGASNG